MKISIIGTGYVGLVTGVCLATKGQQVICIDVLPDRVAGINLGESPFYEPGLSELLQQRVADGSLRAATNLTAAVADSDIIMIAVGTPDRDGAIDLSDVKAAAREIGDALRTNKAYKVVTLKSTVVPGTTDTMVRQAVESASGKRAGEFGMCMNPEFLREGNAIEDFMEPDRIIIGQWDEASGQALAAVYRGFDCPLILTTLRNAEMIKYASNALLATLISFSNELASLCEATPGMDIEMVMDGLHLDKRLSPLVAGERVQPGILTYLRAGCGYGGSCLPKDVTALRAYAREAKIPTPLLDAVASINTRRPQQLAALVEKALGTLSGASLAVFGLTFKAGTDDLRSSPALAVIDQLLIKGASVRAYDPLILTDRPPSLDPRVTLNENPEAALTGADAALLVTSWPEFATYDWQALSAKMRRPVIIDGRNALRQIEWDRNVTYLPIGRMPQ